MTTAAMVPSWITAVNDAPGSPQPKSSGTMRRWPLDDTGRNSVRPCTIPKMMASKYDIRDTLSPQRSTEGHPRPTLRPVGSDGHAPIRGWLEGSMRDRWGERTVEGEGLTTTGEDDVIAQRRPRRTRRTWTAASVMLV